jgi:hypothetical protein
VASQPVYEDSKEEGLFVSKGGGTSAAGGWVVSTKRTEMATPFVKDGMSDLAEEVSSVGAKKSFGMIRRCITGTA